METPTESEVSTDELSTPASTISPLTPKSLSSTPLTPANEPSQPVMRKRKLSDSAEQGESSGKKVARKRNGDEETSDTGTSDSSRAIDTEKPGPSQVIHTERPSPSRAIDTAEPGPSWASDTGCKRQGEVHKQGSTRHEEEKTNDEESEFHLLSYKCKSCEFETQVISSLMEHKCESKHSRTFHCKHCEEIFMTRLALNAHVHFIHGKPLKCSLCGLKFMNENVLAYHEFIEHAPFAYCRICGQYFSSFPLLTKHKKEQHDFDRLYISCRICKQLFLSRESLIAHLLSKHVCMKRHICPVYSMKYAEVNQLQDHLRETHREEEVTLPSTSDPQISVQFREEYVTLMKNYDEHAKIINTERTDKRTEIIDQRIKRCTARLREITDPHNLGFPQTIDMEMPGPSQAIVTKMPGSSRAIDTEKPGPSRAIDTEKPGPSRAIDTEEPGPSWTIDTETPGPSRAIDTETPGPSSASDTGCKRGQISQDEAHEEDSTHHEEEQTPHEETEFHLLSYKCDTCTFETQLIASLKKHKCKQVAKFHCKYCGKVFKTRFALNSHLHFIHAQPLKCDLCGLNFMNESILRNHQLTEHSPNPICSICGRLFGDYELLCKHRLEEHDYGRIYISCRICKQLFQSKESLMAHVISNHVRMKRHICPVYSRKYADINQLRDHLQQTHEGEEVTLPLNSDPPVNSIEYFREYMKLITDYEKYVQMINAGRTDSANQSARHSTEQETVDTEMPGPSQAIDTEMPGPSHAIDTEKPSPSPELSSDEDD